MTIYKLILYRWLLLFVTLHPSLEHLTPVIKAWSRDYAKSTNTYVSLA